MKDIYRYTYEKTPNYCYKDSDVLINLLNIRNQDELYIAEREISGYRTIELKRKPIKGNFDFKYLKSIHKYIFQDIYSWAGVLRTCNIAKTDLFCLTENIEIYGNSIFQNLRKDDYYLKYDFNIKVRKLTDLFCDINALHPFREGNGRTQRYYIEALASVIGVYLNVSNTSKEDMIIASHEANNGNNAKMLEIFSRNASILDISEQKRNINKYCLNQIKNTILDLLK